MASLEGLNAAFNLMHLMLLLYICYVVTKIWREHKDDENR